VTAGTHVTREMSESPFRDPGGRVTVDRMDTTFKADVDSLGHWSVANLPGVKAVRITSCQADRTAHMEISLISDTWPNRERAIDAMIEIIEMFFDDFAISYVFADIGEDTAAAQGPRTLVYA